MLIQLCFVVSLGHIAISQGQSLVPCATKPSAYVGPALPTLPDQFQMHIEANIVQKNITRNFVEFYDYPGNRGVIMTYNKTTKETRRTVMKFNEKEARIIYQDKTCRFLKTNTSNSAFGFMAAEDGAHIKSVKDLLYFGKDLGEEHIGGNETVRGISVNHWKTCVKIPQVDGMFELDYYFSKGSGYFIDGDEIQVPVRAVINGTGKTRRNGKISEDVHSFYHIYEFFDFKPGIIYDPQVFEVPIGVICDQGDMKANEPAPVMSHQFSAGIERVILQQGTEVKRETSQLYMDYAARIFRMDVDIPIGRDASHYGNRPLTYVNDVSTGLRYVIDRMGQNCTVAEFTVPQGVVLPPPKIISDFFGDFSSFIYQGQKTWRGMLVDSWGLHNTTSKEFIEIFFHRPEPGPAGTLDPHLIGNMIPVGVYKHGYNLAGRPNVEVATYDHMFGFTNGHPDPEIFDVSLCYALDQHSTYLALDITGRDVDEVLQFHQREFVSEVRQTVATAAKVSVTRIASLKWEVARSKSTSTTLLVTFQLLDNRIHGLDDKVDTGPSLSDALSNLKKSVNSGSSIVFDINLGTAHSVRFSILAGSLWEVYKEDLSVAPPTSTIKKYGSGAMAGLALGMLIIGALLGLIAAFIIYKRINTSVPYEITK